MRSIGKRNIDLVKRITLEEINKRKDCLGLRGSYEGIEDQITTRLPMKLWDTWEMADQEIRRIINDTIMES